MAAACSLLQPCTLAQQQRPLPTSSASLKHSSQLLVNHLLPFSPPKLNQRRTKRLPNCVVRSASSAGAFVDEESSWQKEEKKRLIAGVDQTRLLDPHLLADPDSRFAEYYGVQLHYKISRPSSQLEPETAQNAVTGNDSGEAKETAEKEEFILPAILLHGFGASLFSWERVMPKLAQILRAPALAFDRPAFGFTSRPFPSKESAEQKFGSVYSVAYSAAATLAFVNFLQSDQAILIGHSAGSLVAVEAFFQSPEKVAALVLVAPALVAPLLARQIEEAKQSRTTENTVEGEMRSETAKPFAKVLAALRWTWEKFVNLVKFARRFVAQAMIKLLGFLFRSPPAVWLVRRIMDKGGPWAVRFAYYDVLKADEYVLDGYTRPLQCRDWERALLEYCLALINSTEDQVLGKKSLQEITCPVLVVTGDTDRIVPDWNGERLAKVFPRGEFKRIKNCGHLPQEETPDELLEIIKHWLDLILKKEKPSIGMEFS